MPRRAGCGKGVWSFLVSEVFNYGGVDVSQVLRLEIEERPRLQAAN